MTDLDHGLLRKLAEWEPGGVPITSVYLPVDGGRFVRKVDYEVRLDELLRRARAQAAGLGREAEHSVARDVAAMSEFVREEFGRKDTRGLAMFSAQAAGLWEVVRVTRPVRDRCLVGPQPDLLPLEALLETYRPTCVALVDFEKARVFVVEMGRIEETSDVRDEVPGRVDRGGRAQMRIQRHVEDHRIQHLKHVADALFRVWRRRHFEHLVLAGPAEAHRELETHLHDYVRRTVCASLQMQMSATSTEVLRGALEVEERLELEREAEAIERLRAATSNAHGVTGLDASLEALAAARVGELLVALELSAPGFACPSCGRLSASGGACRTCGARTRGVPDVVEAAVTQAVRGGCGVETIVHGGLGELGGVGALLRF